MSVTKSASKFTRFAKWTAQAAGAPATFVLAVAVVLTWGVSGPLFGFSDTWQLVINTGTTIITFLMAFLIQNTQNRDSQAMHIKMDELIRAAGFEITDLTESHLPGPKIMTFMYEGTAVPSGGAAPPPPRGPTRR